jgi:glutamine---fructose-6-phosphate transaminase (isomerizing)
MTRPAWLTDDFPELRPGPPWVMEEMMARQPELVAPILAAPGAAEIAAAARGAGVVTVTGCGTSEHAAHGIAALLSAALGPGRVRALSAFSAALAPAPGLCIGVSHEGGTRATRLALEAARAAGAQTALVTANAEAELRQVAGQVLVTPFTDCAWCHTVGYTTALLAGAAIARELGLERVDADAAAALLGGAQRGPEAAQIAAALAGARVILCAGAGADHVTARELALKLAEGARMPTAGLELETVLHGQLAGHEPPDALVLVGFADDERVARRGALVAAATRRLGLPTAALLSPAAAARMPGGLTGGGRLVSVAAQGLEPTLAALLAGAAALQALTLELAHARGVNPDLIRREEEPYRRAAAAAEGDRAW